MRTAAKPARADTLDPDSGVGWRLPTAEQTSVQDIFAAMSAAEAAQQQLLVSGRLAEAAAGSAVMKDVLTSYSTVQKLYHKGYSAFLDRYQQMAVSPAGVWDRRKDRTLRI